MDLINDAKLMRAELTAARMAIKSLQQQAAFERRRVDLLTIECNQLRARLNDGAEKNPDFRVDLINEAKLMRAGLAAARMAIKAL